ncbi:hypothetical protein [Catellatospora tritici]|uniref:hypothetical protein n=1 Tax=Catellatospora tritici TaxID=2851566 RepID=UPI001C2D18C0|nr:hypothetical protein [Catellatospora tritici]MBV1851885.1 hypothetical protein [Catellatospora tritici]
MEIIALSDGDLGWVFPGLHDAGEVSDLLRQADAQIRLLADHLGVRPSWTGSGIEFHRLPQGQTDLFGCAEKDDVSFTVGLGSFNRGGSSGVGPPWDIDSSIEVRCDGRVDCGMHSIEEASERQVDSPLEAARALLEAVIWLRNRAVAEPLESWRQRDVLSGHH